MNLFAMKASYPLDDLTLQEMNTLISNSEYPAHVDLYEVMQFARLQDATCNGFLVLAYDDDVDQLIGAVNAYDLFGMNAFEWSMVVHPDYRNIGIEEVLIEGLKHGLNERESTGEMAAIVSIAKYNALLEEQGYEYNSSKYQMAAKPAKLVDETITVIPFEQAHLPQLQQIFAEGFGDLPEETAEMAALMEEEESSQLWMVLRDKAVVGTFTTAVVADDVWLTSVATKEQFRNQGIALSMLNWVKNYTCEKNFSSIAVEVESDNPAAVQLYKKSGFNITTQIDYFVVK